MEAQNTGNPVLDTTVNLVAALGQQVPVRIDDVERIHALVLKMSKEEPMGLQRPK